MFSVGVWCGVVWCGVVSGQGEQVSSCRPSSTPTPLPRAENEKGRAGNRLTSTHGGGGCWGGGSVEVLRYFCTSVPGGPGSSTRQGKEPSVDGGGPGDGTFPQSISTGARPTHLISIAPHLNPHSAQRPSPSESPPSRVVDPDCCSPPLHVQRPGMGKSAPDRNRKHTKPWAPATACWFPPWSAHFAILLLAYHTRGSPDFRSEIRLFLSDCSTPFATPKHHPVLATLG